MITMMLTMAFTITAGPSMTSTAMYMQARSVIPVRTRAPVNLTSSVKKTSFSILLLSKTYSFVVMNETKTVIVQEIMLLTVFGNPSSLYKTAYRAMLSKVETVPKKPYARNRRCLYNKGCEFFFQFVHKPSSGGYFETTSPFAVILL